MSNTSDLTAEQAAHLADLREQHWAIRITRREPDGTLRVDGTDPYGDSFRGHIAAAGAFISTSSLTGGWLGISFDADLLAVDRKDPR